MCWWRFFMLVARKRVNWFEGPDFGLMVWIVLPTSLPTASIPGSGGGSPSPPCPAGQRWSTKSDRSKWSLFSCFANVGIRNVTSVQDPFCNFWTFYINSFSSFDDPNSLLVDPNPDVSNWPPFSILNADKNFFFPPQFILLIISGSQNTLYPIIIHV